MNPISLSQPWRIVGYNSLVRTSMPRNASALQFLMRKNVRHNSFNAPAQTTATEHNQILNAQRTARPLSPFTIYQPQLTSIMSIFHRVTGAGLGVVFYGGAIAYALSGPIGLEFNSDSIVASVANLPSAIKYIGKFSLAFPFTYHSFNGIRHLIWDVGGALSLKGVYRTGYVVVGLSVLSAAGLAAL